jgi:hypothetical protein
VPEERSDEKFVYLSIHHAHTPLHLHASMPTSRHTHLHAFHTSMPTCPRVGIHAFVSTPSSPRLRLHAFVSTPSTPLPPYLHAFTRYHTHPHVGTRTRMPLRLRPRTYLHAQALPCTPTRLHAFHASMTTCPHTPARFHSVTEPIARTRNHR